MHRKRKGLQSYFSRPLRHSVRCKWHILLRLLFRYVQHAPSPTCFASGRCFAPRHGQAVTLHKAQYFGRFTPPSSIPPCDLYGLKTSENGSFCYVYTPYSFLIFITDATDGEFRKKLDVRLLPPLSLNQYKFLSSNFSIFQ
jgi:hypothetical protein